MPNFTDLPVGEGTTAEDWMNQLRRERDRLLDVLVETEALHSSAGAGSSIIAEIDRLSGIIFRDTAYLNKGVK